MKSLEIKKDIHWVGALDPNLRIFDIIMYTPYGTTYNSYVVKGSEKTAIFETVKAEFFQEYLERLNALDINPKDIDYIVVDHTEPDHAGSVAKLLEIAPNAKVVGSAVAIRFLKQIVNRDFESIAVKDGSTLSLGNKTLKFISAPFLHWPDSIYTYIPEDNTLITCDSFGSHYSSPAILNSKIESKENYKEALRYYYDCIFGPYKPYVLKAIDKIENLNIDLICPGHGPVLVENPMEIVKTYKEWSTPEPQAEDAKKIVTIPYVSAYGYTEQLANEIANGIQASGDIDVRLFNVTHSKTEDILASIGESKGLLFGSPTIVAELLEPIRDIMSKLNPVVHGGKLAAAFGSYGWSGEAIPRMETRLKELNMRLLGPSLKINFKASDSEIKQAFDFGFNFGEVLLGKKDFVPFDNKHHKVVEIPTKGKKRLWKCIICGEIFEAVDVLDICPICGAGSDQFIEVKKSEPIVSIDKEETYVIIGNGAAGFTAAKSIRKRNSKGVIKIISDENEHSYVRTQLSDLISEKADDTFFMADPNWYKENNIIEILNVSVQSIDSNLKKIKLSNNEEIAYDKLILANGSHNFVPPTKVITNNSEVIINSTNFNTIKGIHSIKKLEDIKNVNNNLSTAKNVVIVGGGLLGLEAAWEIQKRNIDVKVIELSKRILPNQLDIEGSEIFDNIVKNSSIDMLLGESIDHIIADETGVKSVQLKSGTQIPADMILYSVGVRPNIDLAKSINIECNKGILVNQQMETNIDDIFACGDVAEYNGLYYGNWPAALEMGNVAGANATEDNIKFEEFVSSIVFNAINTTIFSAGVIDFNDENLEKISSVDLSNNRYTKLFFSNNILVGGILIGDISASVKIILGIQNKEDKLTALSHGIL